MLTDNYRVREISSKEFIIIRRMAYEHIGVNLTEAKKNLVISRLSKRLSKYNLASFKDYIKLVQDDAGELEVMFNLLTTNVTKFFREPYHFSYLCREYLPQLEAMATKGLIPKKIRAWSAACSSGEEPYTMAMVINDYFAAKKGWDIKILASDINTETLDKAKTGIYTKQEVAEIPYETLTKYFKLGTGVNHNLFKVKEALRKMVTFRQINLTAAREYPLGESVDLIFCRNVFIYFDKETQAKVLKRFHHHLRSGGWLFLGHSESVQPTPELQGKWQLCRHTVYRRCP